ncbi:MAG: MGMT family protein [Nitrosopumilus sp.]|nr:MGMT family protein [Nitrosopumilus sp.]MDA7953027.1 MGMT family protein [Nitrosopumilus sp.]MDA7958710.1 MGMT family protein [Nitrosopumilus sp.]
MEVPPGSVTTYADLARAAGIPGGQRAVGNAMASNPYPGVVPCHRVVRSDGRVGGFALGQEMKESMLRAEGVEVGRGRVSKFEGRLHRF